MYRRNYDHAVLPRCLLPFSDSDHRGEGELCDDVSRGVPCKDALLTPGNIGVGKVVRLVL